MREEFAPFLADFGELVTIASRSVRAIFDAPYADALGVVGITPQLTCASVDVAGVVRGSAAIVRGVAYTVAEVQPDGTGVTVLVLAAP